jgi:ABC-type phosphate transport system substrate-binding protein
MLHPFRVIGGAVAAAALVTPVAAHAQVACDSLPNPIVVVGTTALDPALKQFAVRLAAASPATTIISAAVASQTTSCAGITSLVNGTDLGGLPGRTYTLNGSTITTNTCTFAGGQKAHVALSDVFYESCASAPQPKPADIVDVTGPVQTTVFVAPISNTMVKYLTNAEVQDIYGCGVSATMPMAGYFDSPSDVFCRDVDAGTRVTLAKNVGLNVASMKCAFLNVDSRLVYDLTPRPKTASDPEYNAPPKTLGFVAASEIDRKRDVLTLLAFQAAGQTRAYYADSTTVTADRANVRDGHYPLWGYEHFVVKTTDGKMSTQASDLIGWFNGTKTIPDTDHVIIEGSLGLIPACAMRVQRSSDGGLLSPYKPSQPCSCAFIAASARAIPPECAPCLSPDVCTGGKSCRHGFCE